MKIKRTFLTTCFIVSCLILINALNKSDLNFIIKSLLFLWGIQLSGFFIYYSEYLLRGIKIKGLPFSKDLSILNNIWFSSRFNLPKDKNLFQNSKYNSCAHSKLPMINLNDYDFSNTSITWCSFHENTILSNDKNFFQKIRNKSIQGVTLPCGDYSSYNFKNVNIRNVKFRDGSNLPQDINLFQYSKCGLPLRIRLPKNASKSIHYYNLKNVDLQLIEKLHITKEQYIILSKEMSSDSLKNSFILST